MPSPEASTSSPAGLPPGCCRKPYSRNRNPLPFRLLILVFYRRQVDAVLEKPQVQQGFGSLFNLQHVVHSTEKLAVVMSKGSPALTTILRNLKHQRLRVFFFFLPTTGIDTVFDLTVIVHAKVEAESVALPDSVPLANSSPEVALYSRSVIPSGSSPPKLNSEARKVSSSSATKALIFLPAKPKASHSSSVSRFFTHRSPNRSA